jgi:F0F1-type ATP synthase membrane subunit b/b'
MVKEKTCMHWIIEFSFHQIVLALALMMIIYFIKWGKLNKSFNNRMRKKKKRRHGTDHTK